MKTVFLVIDSPTPTVVISMSASSYAKITFHSIPDSFSPVNLISLFIYNATLQIDSPEKTSYFEDFLDFLWCR